MVTIRRPGHPERTEESLPGSGWFTPTSLLHDLLAWRDEGKAWGDIDPGVRRMVARDLRALADAVDCP
jgi:hypothetical protein